MVQRFVRGWRQAPVCLGLSIHDQRMTLVEWHAAGAAQPSVPVSYTHLTLPTN